MKAPMVRLTEAAFPRLVGQRITMNLGGKLVTGKVLPGLLRLDTGEPVLRLCAGKTYNIVATGGAALLRQRTA